MKSWNEMTTEEKLDHLRFQNDALSQNLDGARRYMALLEDALKRALNQIEELQKKLP